MVSVYVQCMGEVVDGESIVASNKEDNAGYCAIRPMVEINLDAVKIGPEGTGTNTDPYSMELK